MTDETQKPKIETGNSKFETGDSESGIRNSEGAAGSSVLVDEPSTIDPQQPPVAEATNNETIRHQLSLTLPLLLEVGCEEIPARFLRDAEKGLGERVQAALLQAGLIGPATATKRSRAAEVRTNSTPRRLVVHVPALMAQQSDKAWGHPSKSPSTAKANIPGLRRASPKGILPEWRTWLARRRPKGNICP